MIKAQSEMIGLMYFLKSTPLRKPDSNYANLPNASLILRNASTKLSSDAA